jgi:hypothetical protein
MPLSSNYHAAQGGTLHQKDHILAMLRDKHAASRVVVNSANGKDGPKLFGALHHFTFALPPKLVETRLRLCVDPVPRVIVLGQRSPAGASISRTASACCLHGAHIPSKIVQPEQLTSYANKPLRCSMPWVEVLMKASSRDAKPEHFRYCSEFSVR